MRFFSLFRRASIVSNNRAPSISREILTETARHVRQIQFYLLLICLGLLLAVSLPRDTALDIATAQLDEVIRFQSEVGDTPLCEVAGTAPPEWSGPRTPTAAVLFKFPLDATDQVRVCFVYENEFIPGAYRLLHREGVTDFRNVETHEEFVELWDTLAREDAFLRVGQYADFAYLQEAGANGLDPGQPIQSRRVTDADEVQRLFDEAFSLTSSSNLTPTLGQWVDLDQEIDGQQYSRGIQLQRSSAMIGGPEAVILPVATQPARLPILKRLLDRCPTPFKYLNANDYWLVHEELADWTLGESLDQTSLHTMKSSLNTTRVLQGEKFDVFGFGIPYEFLFKYGLLVLVSVQLFFWAHLRSFRLLSADSAPSVWIPWLPLYPNRTSRAMAIGLIIIFPMGVIGLLVRAADISLSSQVLAAVGGFTACMLLVEFLRLWHGGPMTQQTNLTHQKSQAA